jgi:hypothetical protein
MGSAVRKLEDSEIGAAGRERRREVRFPLGLPVGVQLAGRELPITVEVLDLSARGGRFCCIDERVRVDVRVDQMASLSFILQDQSRCFAQGRVVRSEPGGEFALRIEASNDAFRAFISQLGM